MSREDELQIAVANYLRLQHPHAFWCHVANERKTSPARGAKLKKMGVRAGMPDILIFTKTGNKNGLAIELKIKPNKPTDSQLDCLKELFVCRWRTALCYTFEEAKEVIDKYLSCSDD